MNALNQLYKLLEQHTSILVDGTFENFRLNISKDELESTTCSKKANFTVALETNSCSFTIAHLQSGLTKSEEGTFSLGSGFESVTISFDNVEEGNKNLTSTATSPIGESLLQAFLYIEQVRSYGVNAGGKRRISKEKCADLYFAGKNIINTIQKFGKPEDKKRFTEEIKKLEKNFKTHS